MKRSIMKFLCKVTVALFGITTSACVFEFEAKRGRGPDGEPVDEFKIGGQWRT